MNPTSRRGFLLSCSAGAAGALVASSFAGVDSRPKLAESDAFLAAVERGDDVAVRAMLVERPELKDAADDRGRSVVVLACIRGHRRVVDALLAHGPRLDLMDACVVPDWDRATELARAHPERLNEDHPVGGNVLYGAARSGARGIWRLQTLGAETDGNPRGRDGVTPAHGALECVDPVRAWILATDLLANGGDVNARQRGGERLLHVAARRGDPRLLRFLIRKGADVDARDDLGRTALDVAEQLEVGSSVAVLRSHETVVRDDSTQRYAFDANGAPVVWPDLSDLSLADHHAVTNPSHANLAAVRAVVDADPRRSFARSSQDELAIEASSHTGAREIARYHLDHGVPQSLATSLSIGDLTRAKTLLERNPSSVNERGPHDFAMTWYCSIAGGSIEAAELLLAYGADVDQQALGATALHWAASSGHLDLIRFLIDAGADADAVSHWFEPEGQTPAQVADARDQAAAARLLRSLG